MTSTVLDVTVLLLCVSASVVALGTAGDDIGHEGPTADDIADRLVTETVTVSYQAPAAPNDTRTIHWTRGELLAIIATEEKIGDDSALEADNFESAVKSAIADGVGSRTQITAHTPLTRKNTAIDSDGNHMNDGASESRISSGTDFTTDPPRDTSERFQSSEDSNKTAWSTDKTGGSPWWIPGTGGTPWWVDETTEVPEALNSDPNPMVPLESLGEPQSESRGAQEPVRIGSDPPQTADITTAVVTQPTPSGSVTAGSVTIVIRRW